MITHDLGVARLVSDRIHVMRAGVFVESGDARDVVERPTTEYAQALLAAVPTLGAWDETGTAPADADRTEEAAR